MRVSREAFLGDTQLQDAVIRRLEIIGEASRSVSSRTQDPLSQIPWTEMVGMRTLMIRDYDDVVMVIVWDTVQHIWEALRQDNTVRLTPVFDRDHALRATGEMRTWFTGKPCERTRKSHINVCVYDRAWEVSDAFVLDDSAHVAAWVKNDHGGFGNWRCAISKSPGEIRDILTACDTS